MSKHVRQRRAASADVLIGADGIHSTVRRALLGAERPRFACRAYRGLIPVGSGARHLRRESTALARAGPAFCALFRVGGPAAEFRRPRRAGRLDQRILDRAGQRRRPARGLCRAGTRRSSASSTRSTRPSYGRCSTACRWRAGRLAASPCSAMPAIPCCRSWARAAAQAIEDAAALTACLLNAGDDVAAALKLYETVRLPRASRIQEISLGQQDPVPHARWARPDGARRPDGRRA